MYKKIITSLICAVMVVAFSMGIVGCGELPQLATPQNVDCSDSGLITWDPVEHADYYAVVLNDKKYRSDTTSYQVGSTVNDFTYAVIALADKGYSMSDPSETKTFKGKPLTPPVNPLFENLTVSVTGNQLVGSGRSTQLLAAVNLPDGGIAEGGVTWEVVAGKEYGTVDQTGLFTAATVEEDQDVTVRATSKQNTSKYGEITIGVACQPSLTDAMLDDLKDPYISFDGYMDIDLYTFGLYVTYVRTENLYGISAQMNGERWHASYVDDYGYTSAIDYKNEGGIAQQVVLSLMNDEEYYPMTDSRGDTVSWEDAGLKNQFVSLTASDFEFDEQSWRYYYTGGDDELAQKMVTSASPYDFTVNRFGLIIEGGELLGIYAESKETYTVSEGYMAIEKLYSYVNCGEENVTVPEISKFEKNPELQGGGRIDHDSLSDAIEAMQSLTSYKMDVSFSTNFQGTRMLNGYTETVVDGDYFFQPYNINATTGAYEYEAGYEYGYHRVNDNLYNSYATDKDDSSKFVAWRAFKGSMDNAKASFAFAPEIFTSYAGDATFDEKPAKLYMAHNSMCYVATTLYYGVGTDMPLYGQFAMTWDMIWEYPPVLIVQDGHIVFAQFFFLLGDMYGSMNIEYYDFDTATLPDKASNYDWGNDYEARNVPASWSEITVEDDTLYEDQDTLVVSADEFFELMFGDDGKKVPFFGEVLEDSFGFAMTSYRILKYQSQAAHTLVLYYDVPLDNSRSLETAIKTVQTFLVEKGFEPNARGEYVKDNIVVEPYDQDLDFIIYVWKLK